MINSNIRNFKFSINVCLINLQNNNKKNQLKNIIINLYKMKIKKKIQYKIMINKEKFNRMQYLTNQKRNLKIFKI